MTDNRYSNSKIYKIVNENTGMFYIGSTCLPLHKRFYQHKHNSKKDKHKNIKLYKYFTEPTFDDFKIVLVEEFNLENKEQLKREENKYIEKFINDDKCLNMNLSYTGLDKNEYCKLYHQENRKKIIEQKKEYRKENIDYFRNYDRIRNQYDERKMKMKEYKSQKFICICGAEIRNDSRSKHNKTIKHIKFIESQK